MVCFYDDSEPSFPAQSAVKNFHSMITTGKNNRLRPCQRFRKEFEMTTDFGMEHENMIKSLVGQFYGPMRRLKAFHVLTE